MSNVGRTEGNIPSEIALTPVGIGSDYKLSESCVQLFKNILTLEQDVKKADEEVYAAMQQSQFDFSPSDYTNAESKASQVSENLDKTKKIAFKILKSQIERLDVDKSFEAIHSAVRQHQTNKKWDKVVTLSVLSSSPDLTGTELSDRSAPKESQ